MRKLLLVVANFFLLVSTSMYAQVEHGVLVGGGIGLPMQDKQKFISPTDDLGYNHDLKGNLNTLKHFNNGPSHGCKGHLSDLMLSVYIPFSIK